MKNNFWLPLAAISALLAGFYWFTDHDGNELPYEEKIDDFRSEINYFMRNSESSPFADSTLTFDRLEYYPIDPNFKISAAFTPAESLVKLDLATSDGKQRSYITYGYLNFTISGKPQRLTVYQSAKPDDNELFLGFGDETSAAETYGGGRYLNIIHNGGDTIELDFNLAYNPYCAYNEVFVCPFPPRENILDVAITAGEKDYKKLPIVN